MGKKLVIFGVDYSNNAIGKDAAWYSKETFSFEGSKGSKQFQLTQTIVAGTSTRLKVKSVSADGGGLFFGVAYSDGTMESNVWGGATYVDSTTSEFICPKDITAITLWTASTATAEFEFQVYE